MMRTVVEAGMMMIMIKLMNDEGHSDESDDNDDVLSIFISSLASVIKTGIFQPHMNVVDGPCDNSRSD